MFYAWSPITFITRTGVRHWSRNEEPQTKGRRAASGSRAAFCPPLAYGIAKAGEEVKMKRWKLIPLQKGDFCTCGCNRRDVILFSVVRKITASRENRRELLGDEVMKTASHRNCTVQVTLVEFEQLFCRAGNGSLFLYTANPLCWFQSRSLTSLFSAVQYNRVSNMRIHSTL